MKPALLLITLCPFILGCTSPTSNMAEEEDVAKEEILMIQEITDHIIALETQALTNWAKGDLVGFTVNFREDATYVDNMLAADGIAGLDSIKAYMARLESMDMIGEHDFEIKDAYVQIFDNTAILSLRHHAFEGDGTPAPIWKASVVYIKEGDKWQVAHANWSPVECPDEN